jgi:predicted metal-dependent phosphoesterase TrpH
LDQLDGIEVYNAGNLPEMNDQAQKLAEELGLACTAGSDGHGTDTAGRAGIGAKERIRDNEDLVRVLKSGDYVLLR